MDKIDRASLYRFLQKLVENHPDDPVAFLQDIIVNDCVYPQDEADEQLAVSELDARIGIFLAEGKKIEAVKIAKDTLRIGLREAKDYVESRNLQPKRLKPQIDPTLQQIKVQQWMDKVANNYGLNGWRHI